MYIHDNPLMGVEQEYFYLFGELVGARPTSEHENPIPILEAMSVGSCLFHGGYLSPGI